MESTFLSFLLKSHFCHLPEMVILNHRFKKKKKKKWDWEWFAKTWLTGASTASRDKGGISQEFPLPPPPQAPFPQCLYTFSATTHQRIFHSKPFKGQGFCDSFFLWEGFLPASWSLAAAKKCDPKVTFRLELSKTRWVCYCMALKETQNDKGS